MNKEYLLFIVLFLVGLTIRNVYEWLKKSGKVESKNKMVFALVFAAMWLMWAGWFEMCPRDPWRKAFPSIVRWSGLGVVGLGFVLAVGSLIQLRGLENIDRLVSGGLFTKIRHPMYVGFILWILGWAMVHGALVSLIVGFAGIGSIIYWQKLEDASLEWRFGDDYREYRKNTWS
jgi:protein-S-isoprenylcysteine O-methyltransferase Ste14